MAEYLVAIQVIKVYNITVDAESEDDAERKAYALQTAEIENRGNLQDVESDFAEVIGGPN